MGTIPSETIEQIAAANDIVEVIGSYFPLKRAGTNFKALCPFHQEKTPSFMVGPSRETFHCFGWGAGGGGLRVRARGRRERLPVWGVLRAYRFSHRRPQTRGASWHYGGREVGRAWGGR